MGKRILLVLAGLVLFSQSGAAQWVQTNGPYGGNVHCFATIGTNIFAGLYGGLFRSTDSGTTWTAANQGIPPQREQPGPYVYSLAAMGTNLFETSGDGVFRSTDSGRSWSYAGLSIVGNGIGTLAVCGSNLYAAGFGTTDYANGDNFFRSTDSGANWTADSLGKAGNDVYSLGVIGKTLLAGSWYGLFRSTDDGATWACASKGMINNPYVDAFAVCGRDIFAGTEGGGIYRSTDSGRTWMTTGTGNLVVHAMAVSDKNIYAASHNGVLISTDNGMSWDSANAGLGNQDVQALGVDGSNVFAGVPYLGVFRSTNNGFIWTATSDGLMPLDVSAFAVRGTNFFAGINGWFFGSIFRSNNSATNWTLDGDLDGDVIANESVLALAVSGTRIYVGTNGGVFRSADSGTGWTNMGLDSAVVDAIAISGATLFAGTYAGGLFRSTDSGSSWKQVGFLSPLLSVNAIDTSGTTLFVGTSDSGVYRSTDNGISWVAANTGITSSNGLFYSITAITHIGTTLFAGINVNASYPVGGSVVLSTDSGKSWTPASLTFPRYINSFAVSGTNLFAGTAGGVFFSTDSAATWTVVNEGLTDSEVQALTIKGGDLYAGTFGGGVWRRPLSEMIPSSAVTEQPKATGSMAQAYPNPFSTKTQFKFTTSERGPAGVSIVNMLGVEIARLFSGELDAGEHSFEWDANGTAAGSYFCIVRSSGRVDRVAMMLAR